MSVFENKCKRTVVDDSQILTCNIESAVNIHGHTEYKLKVSHGLHLEKCWYVSHRYSDFVTLHSSLSVSGFDINLPPKRAFGNLDREFIAKRQAGLQVYLDSLLQNPWLSTTFHVRKFLDPTNYSSSCEELALQHVSMLLRGDGHYCVQEVIQNIGWRCQKFYYSVKSINEPKRKLILWWVEYGPDKYLPEKEMMAATKALLSVQHPHISTPEVISTNESGCLVIHQFYQDGTLRDHLCVCKPRQPTLKKYLYPKQYLRLEVGEVRRWSRQILEALRFLHDKGIPYGHLHSGNIVIIDGDCKLLDVMNGICGLSSFYRPYYAQLRKVTSLEAVDVYCFGQVLYEMTFGKPLNKPTCDILPADCPAGIKPILESLLSPDYLKNGIPSLTDLLSTPFFSDIHIIQNPTSLVMSGQLKQNLRVTNEKIERRLHDEQKSIRLAKKISKAHALLHSEDEKKKRKLKKKAELKLQQHRTEGASSPNSGVSSNANSSGTSSPPPSVSGLGTMPPPPPPPLPTEPNETSNATSQSVDVDNKRSALLNSIRSFSHTKLNKVQTDDKSNAKL